MVTFMSHVTVESKAACIFIKDERFKRFEEKPEYLYRSKGECIQTHTQHFFFSFFNFKPFTKLGSDYQIAVCFFVEEYLFEDLLILAF
jgi:hypothetical protein